MFNFIKRAKTRKAVGLTSQNTEQQIAELKLRVMSLEQAVMDMVYGVRAHIDRLDHNDAALQQGLKNIAAMTIRPPRDLLGGNQEIN